MEKIKTRLRDYITCYRHNGNGETTTTVTIDTFLKVANLTEDQIKVMISTEYNKLKSENNSLLTGGECFITGCEIGSFEKNNLFLYEMYFNFSAFVNEVE